MLGARFASGRPADVGRRRAEVRASRECRHARADRARVTEGHHHRAARAANQRAGDEVGGARRGGHPAPPAGKSPTLDRIREQKVLRAGIGISLPWLGQNPKTSQYFGPAIELGDRIAKILAVKLELLPSTWDVIIAGLQANKTDLLLAPLFATEKRRQVVDFVNWTEAGTCYAVLKDNNKVNTLEDLDQPTVSTAVWKGTGTEHAFVAKYKKAKI